MSIKHVKQYYEEITNQYKDLVKTLKELEKSVEDNITPPEFLDTLKETIAPLKSNYERWTYMMYLLNKPNKKEKAKKYDKQFAKIKDSDTTKEENMQCIKKVKKLK